MTTLNNFNTLLNKLGSFSFFGLSDTATSSLPDGYVKFNSTIIKSVYFTTISAASIKGLATIAANGNKNILMENF